MAYILSQARNHLLSIIYNIFDFLLVPAMNKMYEGAAQLHLILAGTS